MAPRFKEFIIPNGETESNVVDVTGIHGGYMQAPPALTGTVTLYASSKGVVFAPATSEGSNITFAAAKATPITMVGGRYWKLVSSGAEAARRPFQLTE